jgi:hypothetical protein
MEGNLLVSWAETDQWFLWKECFKASDIYRRLSAICGEKAPVRSTVFNWGRTFNSGKEMQGGCP